MTVKTEELHKFFKKQVIIEVYPSAAMRDTPVKTEGKILAVNADGVALQIRGNTQVIPLADIVTCVENPRIRKKRVVKRWVRVIPLDASCKQHLADRHGILVSVLNVVDEETARSMHDNISHADLGHRHRSPEDRILDLESQDTENEFTEDNNVE